LTTASAEGIQALIYSCPSNIQIKVDRSTTEILHRLEKAEELKLSNASVTSLNTSVQHIAVEFWRLLIRHRILGWIKIMQIAQRNDCVANLAINIRQLLEDVLANRNV